MKRILLFTFCSLCFFTVIAQQIHEIDYDQPGTDNAEFIEVRLPSTADPADFRITLYNGANGSSYNTFTLDASTVTCTVDGSVQYCVWDPSGIDNLQNGAPDGISLYNIATSTLIEFLSYEGTFSVSAGDASGELSTDIGVSETNSTGANLSLQREENGPEWFGPSSMTPGEPNEIPTPIQLSSFTAKPMDNQTITLDWATATEENNEYFNIEHSTNGRDFDAIDQVQGALNSTETRYYSYYHKDAPRGMNYYRLRQVDTDGTFSFSPIEVVKLGADAAFELRPTLADASIQLVLNEELNREATIEIYNVLGRLMTSEVLASGTTQREIQIANLQQGHYFLKMTNGPDTATKRFIKR